MKIEGSKILVLFLSSILLVSCSFVGQWTDTVDNGGFGGSLYICVDGTQLFGSYSEVGVIIGTVNGNKVTGNFIDAGVGEAPCADGTFELTLANDNNSFSGSYDCPDDNDTHSWNSDRIDSNTPTATQCAYLNLAKTVSGRWANGNQFWSICLKSNSYESSYDTTIEGYETGDFFQSGTVISGIYYDADGNAGYSLGFVLKDGQLGNYWWKMTNFGEEIDYNNVNNSELHGVDIYSFQSTSTSSECSQFEDLINTNSNSNSKSSRSSTNSNNNNNSSSSNASIISVSFVIYFILALFF